MKGVVSALAIVGASLAMASCASVGLPGRGAHPVGYDAFYDGALGPFYDGYWAGDGFFRYADGAGRFHRDGGGHFRHQGAGGLQHVQGHRH